MIYYGLDITYWIIMIPFFLLALWAQRKVKSAYKKYSTVRIYSGLSGEEAARKILQQNNLTHISIKRGSGILSDHYNPATKTVRLSPAVYDSSTVAAVGIAAHECGHAIQHAEHYAPLKLRSLLAPTASIGSNFAFVLIMIGGFFAATNLLKIGVALFAVVVLFQLITLPVEFNASTRAKKMLASYGMVNRSELQAVDKVLDAAAMTYVAAAASAAAQLLYLLLRIGFLGGDD